MFFAAGVFLAQIKRPKVKMEVGRSGGGSPVMEGRRIFEQKKGGGRRSLSTHAIHNPTKKRGVLFILFCKDTEKDPNI